ncbi:unnamed protein product [Caenorhabditis sp. 36 PRJEB53466]|nr:unnamed protein product [Caenorhabditis sp. 36 PRJEB53466]
MAQAEDVEPETFMVMKTIECSIVEVDDVDLEHYILFWKHVCKVMSKWGTIFSFVVKDVTAKLEKLTVMRMDDPVAYRTILTMASKERENGTIRNRKPNRSGTGHVMVLNRALEFVIDMLDGVFKAEDPDAKVYSIARSSYDKHLSQIHSWPVRTAVFTALFTLPNRKDFLVRLRGEMPESEDGNFHEVFQRNGIDVVRRVNLLIENFELSDYNPSA